jgi:hypothetical protein
MLLGTYFYKRPKFSLAGFPSLLVKLSTPGDVLNLRTRLPRCGWGQRKYNWLYLHRYQRLICTTDLYEVDETNTVGRHLRTNRFDEGSSQH